MPNFPTTEPEIKALCERMLDGYLRHGPDFPHANRNMLTATRLGYVVTKKAFIEARAKLRIAAKAAEESLQELIQVMKNCLKKSEVDVAGNPNKLTEIGWGPRTIPQPTEPPGGPKNLSILEQGKNSLRLRWDRPQQECIIRHYIIERRKLVTGGSFSNWVIIGTAIGDEINLTRQPRGIRLEYRIRAANTAGTGPASNTVSVVL